MKHLTVALGALSFALPCACGQGLLNMDPDFGDGVKPPSFLSIESSLGWDSQPRAGSSAWQPGTGASSGKGSAFLSNSLGLYYPVMRGANLLDCGVNVSSIWYMDPPAGIREFVNTGAIQASYSRRFDERSSASDAFYFSRETEPNYQIGLSVNRASSGYYLASNHCEFTYKWSTRFSTVSSFYISQIFYDQDLLENENHRQFLISEQIRYALTQKTVATMDYRYGFTRYEENNSAESNSHFILLGLERPLGRFLSLNLKGGAEFRSYDSALGSTNSPHIEGTINYLAKSDTTFRFYCRRALEDTGFAGSEVNDSWRLGFDVSQLLAPGVFLDFNIDNISADSSSVLPGRTPGSEDTFHASVGITCSRPVWRNINFSAAYKYSLVFSDDPLNEYERHHASLGLSCSF